MVKRSRIVTSLTLARFPFVALGWWAALERAPLSTVTFAATAVATDMVDGILARRWNVETDWGSNFDSFADFTFYTSLLVWVYLFNQAPMERHLGLMVTFFGLYALMIVTNYFFKHSIAVHNRVSRTAATVGTLVAFYFIAVGYSEWMLFAVTLFAITDIAQRLHSAVQAIAVSRRGLKE